MSGYSGRTVSTILFLVTTTSIVIGVKTVGLVLMIAFAIMPAAAARLWVRHMHTMIVLAAILGAVCGAAGSYMAVCMGRVPTGPVIVVVLFVVFAFSMLFSPHRSLTQIRVSRRRALAAQAEGN